MAYYRRYRSRYGARRRGGFSRYRRSFSRYRYRFSARRRFSGGRRRRGGYMGHRTRRRFHFAGTRF